MPKMPKCGQNVSELCALQEAERVIAEVHVAGGRAAAAGWTPWLKTEKTPQASRMTTITVVICMTFRAFSLDSSMPLVFSHQK